MMQMHNFFAIHHHSHFGVDMWARVNNPIALKTQKIYDILT